MPIIGDLFLQLILYTYNTVAFHNLGVAIVEISILTRLIFYPFIKQQLHYSRKMNELQPHLSELKVKHKGNQQAFATAQMALFKEHGVNPAAGCLPSLVQIVVLFGLLGAMNHILTMKLNTEFLIWNMAKPDVYKLAGIPLPVPGILVVVAAVTQFIQTKMMLPATVKKIEEKAASAKGSGELKKEDKGFMAEFAEAQTSMVWMFPLLFLFLGTKWPSGLALYWSVSSVMAIGQQYMISGLGGLEQYVVQLKRLGIRG